MNEARVRPLLVTLLFYMLPLASVIVIASLFGIPPYSRQFFSLGFIVIAFGSIAMFLELKNKESKKSILEPSLESIEEHKDEDLKKYEDIESDLKEEIMFRNEEIQKLVQERDLERAEKERIKEDQSLQRQILEEKLEEELIKNLHLLENMSSLKTLLDKKQEEIDRLGGKIHDLTFEIKTLVQIAEFSEEEKPEPVQPIFLKTEPPFFEQSPDAKRQLRRCLDIAQKITGSYHIGGYQSRFRDMALDNYALDLRRLCDSLRSEKGAAVMVYSPKESKLLFINNHVKTLFGYSPEKFMQDFESIVQEGMGEWKKIISQLALISETKTSLIIKNKNNEDVVIQCLLGMIPTGIFKNHVLGVLFP